MEVVIMLIPLALLLAGFFIGSFIWMTKKGQYDDLDTPAMKMLLEDTTQKIINQTQEGES